MAGKLLLIEEVAARLGMTVEDIHKLVDRKKLFAVRGGTTLKFKEELVEQFAADLADGSADSELDAGVAPAMTGTVNVELMDGEEQGAAADSAASSAVDAAAGRTVTGSANAGEVSGLEIDAADNSGVSVFSDSPAANDALAMTMLGTGEEIASGLDLDIDSVVGLSQAAGSALSGAASAAGPATGVGTPGTGTLDLDLSEISMGSGPNQPGSSPTGSLVGSAGNEIDLSNGPRSGPGSALSDAVDSGLSLEDADAAISGIDLGPLDDGQSAEDGGTALAGEDFNVDNGFDGGEEESASVVAVEESGDSSFFGTAAGDSSEFSTDLSSASGDVSAADMTGLEVVRDTKFSLAQVIGLVCCSLLLLTGGFVMFDLMRTIGSPGDLTLSSPLLNPLAGVFGWR